MSKINAYFTFESNCAEAMTFYQGCFGGDIMMVKVNETPMAEQMPPEMQNLVMHASLTSGDIAIMGTEMGGCGPEKLVVGNNIALLVTCDSETEIDKYFAYLSESGTIMCPLGPSFWAAKFGNLKDKFGITWMLNYETK